MMTPSTPVAPSGAVSTAGAPFAAMLRGALVPSALLGAIAGALTVVMRGSEAFAGAALGWLVSLVFFASGMFMLSRLVRSASPHAFFAVGMTVYLGQIIGLLLFLIAFKDAPWLDGVAFGITAVVVTIAWQIFGMIALRKARIPVYDVEGA